MAGGVMHQTTTTQALMSLLKGYIGTGKFGNYFFPFRSVLIFDIRFFSGILAMPKAFSDAGYVLGILGTIVIGLLCNSCIHMLVEINELFITKPDEPPFDYEEVSDFPYFRL